MSRFNPVSGNAALDINAAVIRDIASERARFFSEEYDDALQEARLMVLEEYARCGCAEQAGIWAMCAHRHIIWEAKKERAVRYQMQNRFERHEEVGEVVDNMIVGALSAYSAHELVSKLEAAAKLTPLERRVAREVSTGKSYITIANKFETTPKAIYCAFYRYADKMREAAILLFGPSDASSHYGPLDCWTQSVRVALCDND